MKSGILNAVAATLMGAFVPATLAADLPPEDIVRRVLAESPATHVSSGLITAGQAQQRRLEVGPYEWNLNLEAARRRTAQSDADPGGNSKDWSVGVERPFRLPGKSSLDRELGQSSLALAQANAAQSRLDAARMLLSNWFEWLRSEVRWQQAGEERDLLARDAQAVRRRTQLGDAARLETVQADAALAQAEANLTTQETERLATRELLTSLYPGLPLPEKPAAGEPEALDGQRDQWIEATLENDPALAATRLASEHGKLQARRSELERTGDPTVGLAYTRERNGGDTLYGVFVRVPFGGAARRADAEIAAAESTVATARAMQLDRERRAQATVAWQRTQRSYANWLQNRSAATRMEEAARIQSRAYELGESDLSTLLNARRLSRAAATQAGLARIDALESRYRLMLESKQLWAFE